MSDIDFSAILPFVVLLCGSLTVLLVGTFFGKERTFSRVCLSSAYCVLAWLTSLEYVYGNHTALGGFLRVDSFSFVLFGVILLGSAMTLLLSQGTFRDQRLDASIDFDVLMLLATAGAMVMVASQHLIITFLGIELLSVAVYALCAGARNEKASAESAMKYFILGAFSSAFLLYGILLIYASTASMQLQDIALAVSSSSPKDILLIGIGLVIFGFGFKVSLIPFHFWTPDVYQGAPTTVSGYMAVVVKVAAFGAFLRLMSTAFGNISGAWTDLLWTLSVITMVLGNLMALRQESLKRMLAYSSIAHAGYVLMGFLVMDASGGGEAAVFYLLAYSLMTLIAFGVALHATAGSENQYDNDKIEALRDLGWSNPLLALVMTVSMLSLAGIPPLVGFVGKFYLISAVIKGGYIGLAIIAVLSSLISLYYYLRVVVVMYFLPGTEGKSVVRLDGNELLLSHRVVLAIAALGTIYFGLFSSSYIEYARMAVKSLT